MKYSLLRVFFLAWSVLASLATAQAQSNYATPYTFTTLAGEPRKVHAVIKDRSSRIYPFRL